jgi:rod shape determining protein RodA
MSALRDLILDALKQADHVLLSLCVAANLYGIVLIYSATNYSSALHTSFLKQGVAMCIGIVLYFAVSQLNMDVLRSKWKWLLGFATVLLVLLRTPLGAGDDMGNRAWLRIPGIPFDLQPAEINKIVFTILLAYLLVYLKQQKKLNHLSSVMMLGATLIYFVGLIYVISSDAGSCLIYVAIFIVMLWAAGLHPLWFAGGFAALAGLIYVVWDKIPNDNYQKMRILVVFDHDLDPLGKGFQQSRSLLAIRSGGLTGMGFLQGNLTQSAKYSNLSQRFSDFIFATCCEEWGMIGACVVIFLLAAIIIRCLYVGLTAPDQFSSLVCIGFAGMFIAQVGINIGMCLYVMPVIGLTLPFFSLGGTSIMTNYIIMGLVSGVKNRKKPDWIKHSDTPDLPQKSVLFSPGERRRR